MDNTAEARFTLAGFALAILGGAIAAGAVGYAYYFVANVIGFDLLILLAIFVGAAIGWVVGKAARLGRLRSSLVLVLVGLVFGLVGYAARYYYEYRDMIAAIAAEEVPPGGSPQQMRTESLQLWAEEYPPGGYVGYLRYVAETGFAITDDLFTGEGGGPPIRGTLIWVTFALEGLFAGVVSAAVARATAVGPIGQVQRQ